MYCALANVSIMDSRTTIIIFDISCARSLSQQYNYRLLCSGNRTANASKRPCGYHGKVRFSCFLIVSMISNYSGRTHSIHSFSRFARDCLDQMSKIKVELEATLGGETSDLALRVGLNSGPTTAGVLRGEKSRYQIFGDTARTSEGLTLIAVSETCRSQPMLFCLSSFFPYTGQHGSAHGIQQSPESDHGVAIDGRFHQPSWKESLVDAARRIGPSQGKGCHAVLLVHAPKGCRLGLFWSFVGHGGE